MFGFVGNLHGLIIGQVNRLTNRIFFRTIGFTVSSCGCRIMVIISAFQADDAGSIPVIRSRNFVFRLVANSTGT